MAMTLNETCETLEGLLREYLESTKATGDAAAALRVGWNETQYGLRINVIGKEYLYYIENGRKPGKFPPPPVIRKWIEVKPIISNLSTNSLAFLIGRKIANFGTEGKKYIEKIFNDYADEIKAAITEHRKEWAKKEVQNLVYDINKK